MDKELSYWLRLYFTYGVGPATFLKLLQHFGSVESIYQSNAHTISGLVGAGVAKAIFANDYHSEIERAFQWRDANPKVRHIITLKDSVYPISLAQIAQPPVVLFAEGNIELLEKNKIAIVGTRHPTQTGIDNARSFAMSLAEHDLTIVSGLAAGVDRYAHEGALNAKSGGSTIAVVGTGIDMVYPASNRALFNQVRERGLILSEFPLGTPPISNNFPRRNRIVVGLSSACLVIESTIDGGSMISADFALEMGREILAIPGSIHNPMARGCHKLIKSGAKLCENVHDVLDEIKIQIRHNSIHQQVSETEDPVLRAMGHDPITVDSICAKLQVDFSELCGKLLELELDEQIVDCGGGRYQRVFK